MIGKVRTVLFDLDGTLFDRNKAQGEILRSIVAEFDHLDLAPLNGTKL